MIGGRTSAVVCAALLSPCAALEPLPWSVAERKAIDTLNTLNAEDRRDLLHGSIPSCGSRACPGAEMYAAHTRSIPDLDLPALRMQHGASGFKSPEEAPGTATCFPSMLALASTWDQELAEDYGEAIGKEFKGKGANVFLGPALNVQYNPRDAQSTELLSGEDPLLGSTLGPAFIRGVHSSRVLTVAKNFAVSGVQGQKSMKNEKVDARVAWELLYPPFEAAVNAGVSGVMCSKSMVNGFVSCANSDLLKRDLKETMGFKGFVMSDWNAAEGAGLGGAVTLVPSGLDMEMPTGSVMSEKALKLMDTAIEVGQQKAMDNAAIHVLTSMYQMRLDQEKGCSVRASECRPLAKSDQTSEEHSAIARAVATSAVTLLQNVNLTLPLTKHNARTVAVVGIAADSGAGTGPTEADYYSIGGTGHCRGEAVTPLAGITQRAEQLGINVLSSTSGDLEEAERVAARADVVVVVAGATSDGSDRSLTLEHDVDALITAVAKYKPTVVLMQTAGAVLTPWRSQVSSIANLFLAGQETGNAWAAFLFNDQAPSGKLPVMFPDEENDASEHLSLESSYRSPTVKAAFPFGHGLSYAVFRYGEPKITANGCPGKICMELMIFNIAKYAGSETVQAYFEFPAAAGMPKRILKGFYKTKVLKPGQTELVTFSFSERDLSTYESGAWKSWEGIQAHIGSSSEDIRQTVAFTPTAATQEQEAPRTNIRLRRAA